MTQAPQASQSTQARDFQFYDTTLRDGIQQEGLNVTVDDKLAIAPLLDELGVGFIEGGWPGAIPKDTEFFRRAADTLELHHAAFAAFGATRRAGLAAEDDPQLGGLLDSKAPVVTVVAKAHPEHVLRALHTTLEENLAMVADTVTYLVAAGRRVFVDAEHLFDGFLADAGYARAVVAAAHGAGAEAVVLCDTNGGMLPDQVGRVVADLVRTVPGVALGMHAHNDSGCAVANTLAAVAAGARHVQGTVNGYGERTGNADLLTVAADLELKTDLDVHLPGLAEATRICHTVSALTNVPPYARQPYVGASAFAHKAGLHASAIRVDPDLYQHVDPLVVGNDMRMLVSDMAGRSSIELKGRELGFDLAGRTELLGRVMSRVKALEADGYTFDEADASFELLLREEHDGRRPEYFTVESWRAITESHPGAGRGAESEATVKLHVGERRCVATGEGNGPVNALDAALRAALTESYPQIEAFDLIDYRVRILDAEHGTDAIIRVVIKTTDGVRTWTTVGVGTNIIDASWQALTDAFVYGLLHEAGSRAVAHV